MAHGDPSSVDLTEALSRLRADRDAIAWPERRQIVARIVGPLSEGQAGEPFRSLLLFLAEDTKWEVRKDVADALATIPDNDLATLADKFLSDSHAYDRRAAKQTIERRRKIAREAQKRKRGVELVLALYQELEDLYGKDAADKTRHLAEQLYQHVAKQPIKLKQLDADERAIVIFLPLGLFAGKVAIHRLPQGSDLFASENAGDEQASLTCELLDQLRLLRIAEGLILHRQ